MIRHQQVFELLLITSCTYAMVRGRSEERLVALVSVCATIASAFAVSPLSVRYRGVEMGLLVIDLLVLAAFVLISLRSSRFWPLWVAGLQLTSSAAHFMKAIDEHLLPVAYGTAVAMWSYPILIILAIATWRVRRTVHESLSVTPA
ncbi:MAG TPA: hypothetical protein VGU01_01620 [Sphingomicrobium sp.]|nr:hypothetical protein [Sphingomicrobium sp.]